jgi:hypothetical protein
MPWSFGFHEALQRLHDEYFAVFPGAAKINELQDESQMTFSEYTLENTPIAARPECPKCTALMYLARMSSRVSISVPLNVRGVST